MISRCRAGLHSLKFTAASVTSCSHSLACLKMEIIDLEQLENYLVLCEAQYLLTDIDGDAKANAVVETTDLLVLLGVEISEAEILLEELEGLGHDVLARPAVSMKLMKPWIPSCNWVT